MTDQAHLARETLDIGPDTISAVMDQPFRPTFEAFARSEYRKLVGTLSLYCGDSEIAAEVAHDALVRTMERWDQVRDYDSPSAWLFRVAFNLTHSRFRRRKAEQKAIEQLKPDQPVTIFSSGLVDRIAIKAALLELPAYQRQVIILRYYMGLSVDETAQYLDKTSSSVKSATHRALKSLRSTLEESPLAETAK